MTDLSYQIGDLSSLLGFNSSESNSTLFSKSTPSAFSQQLEKRKAAKSDKYPAKKKKAKRVESELKNAKQDCGGTENGDACLARVALRTGDDEEKLGSANDTDLDFVHDGKEASAAVLNPQNEEKERVNDTAPLSETKNARKKRKRRENALLEEREAEAFEGEDPGKKKKNPMKEDADDDSDEEGKDKRKKFKRDPADDERTIFVGNIPKTTRKNQLMKFFTSCGKVLKIRIRGAVSNDPKQSKKVAAITNNIHNKLDSLFAYIVFEKVESVSNAVEKLNGAEFQDRHIRVDVCKPGVSGTCNEKLSVFVGNLPYDVSEESLRQLFHDSCGDVTRVRCVRDKATRMGKGFGYVEFRSLGAVKDAVSKTEKLLLDGRQLRIKRAALYGKSSGDKAKFMGDSAGNKRRKRKEKRNSKGVPFKTGGMAPKKFGKGGRKNMVKL